MLLDFIDKAEFHVPGIFPALISFFAGEELYDILHIPWGQEAMIHAAIPRQEKNPPKRILLLDDLSQMPALHYSRTQPDSAWWIGTEKPPITSRTDKETIDFFSHILYII